MNNFINEPSHKHPTSKTLNISSKQEYRKIKDI